MRLVLRIRRTALCGEQFRDLRGFQGDTMTSFKLAWAGGLLALIPFMASASIPIAHCRPGDRPESGLSGTITQQEVDRGDPAKGFNCNADIVGQFQGEGASWQLTAWKNCAYFDQRRNAAVAQQGTVVVDVTDPAHPQKTVILGARGMLDPWESLKVNPARQLIAAAEVNQNGFAIYDISVDCKNPVLSADVQLVGNRGHTGQWAPDGNTYYVTPLQASPSVIPIDTKDPTNPKIIPCGQGTPGCNSNGFYVNPAPVSPIVHDLEFSKDGNTAYLSTTGNPLTNGFPNGLVILDVSDFQQRRPNPGFKIIGSLGWNDGSRGAQNALPITIKGKPYILFSDESGAQGGGCAAGMSANGFPRLIDISNPEYVTEIAYLKPPAQGTKLLPASQYANQGGAAAATFVRNYDWSTSKFSWPKDRGMTSGDVWITGQDNGFMVVKLAATAGGDSGGCASADASIGALMIFGVLQLVRRWRARSS